MIHSVNNKPFAKFSQAEREIEVSHWGNIAVEETYELKHVGAKLIGGFSRFDYQTYQINRANDYPVFTTLTAYLPLESRNIYYRDQIGNISTSDITVDNGELNMDVTTRFPLFGGWKTEFYIGYSVPTDVALSVDADRADRYALSLNYFTIFDNIWIDDMEIKIILPEGCSDIDVNVPYEISEQTFGRRFTYLDTKFNGGRPVITMKAKNVVAEHDDEIVINYTFKQSRMYVEPMLVIGMIFILLVLSSIITFINSNSNSNNDEGNDNDKTKNE
jgi:oligosaccharyltransferase complex subunit alpha (ribophorin I)